MEATAKILGEFLVGASVVLEGRPNQFICGVKHPYFVEALT